MDKNGEVSGPAAEAAGSSDTIRRLSAALESQIRFILDSRSWRWTKLLRLGKRVFQAAPALPEPEEAPAAVHALMNAVRQRIDGLQDQVTRLQGPAARARTLDDYTDRAFARAKHRKFYDVDYAPLSEDRVDAETLALKLIAFYLPQFHPIPENDAWRGKGFTEWTTVSKAVPEFVGHHQPRLPGELGFYDLRVPEVMERQIELAKKHGLYGFCFYHYWFAGKKLLDMPLRRFLSRPDWDMNFCLSWANESWSRRWDGSEEEVLLAQRHSPDDDLAFIADIAPALRDRRYIRIDGRPLLLVYRTNLLPNARETAQRWRAYCRANGVGELYLASMQSEESGDPRAYGFDAAVDFPPHKLGPLPRINETMRIVNPDFKGAIFDYRQAAARYLSHAPEGYVNFRGVIAGWDNEARRPARGGTFAFASPLEYAKWLKAACELTLRERAPEERLVFVNAWNEWAEGAYLEPDSKHGYGYLEATANVLKGHRPARTAVEAKLERQAREAQKQSNIAVILHLYYGDVLEEIEAFLESVEGFDLFVSVRPDVSEELLDRLIRKWPNAYIETVANRGRDIAPFLRLLKVASSRGYDYICKIHTKKSLHSRDGARWRASMLQALLGSKDRVRNILAAFEDDPRLGLIAPRGGLLDLAAPGSHEHDQEWLDKLLPGLAAGGLVGTYDCHFPAGSMYWFRPQALKALLELGLEQDSFELEVGQLGGTLAHAVERLVALAAEKAGYRVVDTTELGKRVGKKAPRKSAPGDRSGDHRGRELQIGIFGTFDVENYGDLLFPLIAQYELSRRLGSVKILPFSYHAKSTPRWPYRVFSLAELPDRVSRLDGALIGGGHLIRFDKDIAPAYRPPTDAIHHPAGFWLAPALMALQAGVPVAWNSPGVYGDLPSWARPLLARALEQSDYVAVRDRGSWDWLNGRFAGSGERVQVGPDTVFGLRELLKGRTVPSADFAALRGGAASKRPYILIQDTSGLEDFLGSVGADPRLSQRYDLIVVAIDPVHRDRLDRAALGEGRSIVLEDWPAPLVLAELIGGAAAVVGASLHLAITALAFGAPVFRPEHRAGGKYAVLDKFESVYRFDAARPPSADWFLERIVKGGALSTGAVERIEAELAEHWDKIAAVFSAAPREKNSSPEAARFWEAAPAMLETGRVQESEFDDALLDFPAGTLAEAPGNGCASSTTGPALDRSQQRLQRPSGSTRG